MEWRAFIAFSVQKFCGARWRRVLQSLIRFFDLYQIDGLGSIFSRVYE
jgi:hypothetical protein